MTGARLDPRELRFADWRFLLPVSPASALVVGPERLARGLAAAGVRTVRSASPGTADAAVVSGTGRAVLRTARAALRPGGVIYADCRRPLAAQPGRLRRRLEAAGFADVRCYWSWPPARRRPASLWVPLDHAGAAEHFLASRSRRRAPARRLARAGLAVLWRAARRLGVLAPVCAVARAPSAEEVPPPAGVLAEMAGRWPAMGLGRAPRRVALLLRAPGACGITKLVGFVFAEGADRPAFVLKAARTGAARAALDREVSNLRALESLPAGRPPAPRVVLARQRGTHHVVAHTALAGRPLYEVLSPRSYRDLALKVADWATAMRRDGAGSGGRVAEQALAAVELRLPGALGGPRGAALRQAVTALPADLPTAFEHRDLAPWNVLVDSAGHLAVVDWESSEPFGAPALDLVYFLTYAAFLLDGATTEAACRATYRRVTGPSTALGAVAAEALDRYAARTGVPDRAIPPLRALTWLVHLASAARPGSSSAWESVPGGAPAGPALFLALAEEEIRG